MSNSRTPEPTKLSNDSDGSLNSNSIADKSRVSKWRSSIRSGINKTKKSSKKVANSIKEVQGKALETVNKALPINALGQRGFSKEWSSDDNYYER